MDEGALLSADLQIAKAGSVRQSCDFYGANIYIFVLIQRAFLRIHSDFKSTAV